MNVTSFKLSLKEKLGYATGDFASNLFWQPFTIFLLYYYTDIFGLSAAAVGTMFLITRIWDTFFDPLVGIVADRTQTRWGKFRPYLLWLAIPFGAIGAITYLAPDLSQGGKLIFAYVTYTLMMMIYSLINVPYSALLGVISPDPHARESAASYKFVFAFLAGIVVQAATLPLVNQLGKDDTQIVQAQLVGDKLILHEKSTGSARIIVAATDSTGASKSTEFVVKILKQDLTPPKINKQPTIDTLWAGFKKREIDLLPYFKVSSQEVLKFDAQSDNPRVAKVSVKDNKLILIEKGKGLATITVNASNRAGTATLSFPIVISEEGNTFPRVVGQLEPVTLQRNFKTHILPLENIFTDDAGDALHYFATSTDPKVVGVTVKNDQLVIKEVGLGVSHIIVYAYDSRGGFASDTLTIRILQSGNNPPVVGHPLPNLIFEKGFTTDTLALASVFSDFDGGTLTYAVTVVNEAKGYFHTMSVFAIVAIIMFLVTFATTRERVQPISEKVSSIKDDLKDLLQNKPWLALFALSIFMQIYVAVRQSAIIYYFKYYVGNTQLASWYLVAGTLASLAGAFLIQFAAKKYGKKSSFIVLIIMGSLFTILTYYVKPDQLLPMFALQTILQFFTGPLSPLLWAMYTDSADYSEWKTGRRATGLILSASVFSLKFGWAIGSAITGWLLAYFGFQANVLQNAHAQEGIRLLISYIPTIGLLLAGFTMLFYQLNEKTLAQMTAELAQRRNAKK
ncbi:MAG: MFS transporter [Bacteroidales bacterium]